MEYTSVAEEANTHTGTFALANLSPELSEKSEDVRPLNVPRDRMSKDGLKGFEIFSLHVSLVPHNSTIVKGLAYGKMTSTRTIKGVSTLDRQKFII